MDNYSKVPNLLANTQQKCAFINKLWTSTDKITLAATPCKGESPPHDAGILKWSSSSFALKFVWKERANVCLHKKIEFNSSPLSINKFVPFQSSGKNSS
jgi:hypothetical protein